MKRRFTQKQGQYLAFIHTYTQLHRRPPAETDLCRYFQSPPPSVHQMVVRLHENGLITHIPGQARSIRILVPVDQLPPLATALDPTAPVPLTDRATAADPHALRAARRIVEKVFTRLHQHLLDDTALAHLVRCIAEGVEEELRAGGIDPLRAAAAREKLESYATEAFVRACARRTPETADPDEDASLFRYLMDQPLGTH